jgi:hypothetical protein
MIPEKGSMTRRGFPALFLVPKLFASSSFFLHLVDKRRKDPGLVAKFAKLNRVDL